MILGIDKAKVGNRLVGETFESTVYPVELNGKIYNLYNTVGLGEYKGGAVDNPRAVRNLYRLVTDLSDSGGVNLLLFVIRCGQRLTETMHKNYTLFHHGLCDSEVPIVIVITGCEDVEPMDTWWVDNEASFLKARMPFVGHACVCASKGGRTKSGGYRNEELVNESVGSVQALIVEYCMSNGWKKICHSLTNLEALDYRNTSNLAFHSLASTGRRLDSGPISDIKKSPLSTPNSSIASEMLLPRRKRKVSSKRY